MLHKSADKSVMNRLGCGTGTELLNKLFVFNKQFFEKRIIIRILNAVDESEKLLVHLVIIPGAYRKIFRGIIFAFPCNTDPLDVELLGIIPDVYVRGYFNIVLLVKIIDPRIVRIPYLTVN